LHSDLLAETLAAHRAKTIGSFLLTALRTGYAEVVPQQEPLKVGFFCLPSHTQQLIYVCKKKKKKNIDNDELINLLDTDSTFFLPISGREPDPGEREAYLRTLVNAWDGHERRQDIPDASFVADLSDFLINIADVRVSRVRAWIDANFDRFQAGHASIDDVYHTLNNASIDLHANVHLCKAQCSMCNLLCIQSRLHEGPHDCKTSHKCIHACSFADHPEDVDTSALKLCGMRYVNCYLSRRFLTALTGLATQEGTCEQNKRQAVAYD
jgi:hypothetical protein